VKRRLAAWAIAAVAVAVLVVPGDCRAGEEVTGVEGIAAFRGDFVEGARVLVFTEPGPGPEAVPTVVSQPTDGSGRYRLPLPPGSYYLAAVSTEGDPWPFPNRPGDYFCYYLGNPIVVEPGKVTHVGFNLVKVREEAGGGAGERSGISGQVLFEDTGLGRAYVHIYRDTGTNFRGMGYAAQPTDAEGRFRLRLPPGQYYLLARKRQGGGMYGPPGVNDHIGYYPGNPVEIREGAVKSLSIETTMRVDKLEEIWFAEQQGAGWLKGVVHDSVSAPVEGVYLLFYRNSVTSGAPAFVAGPTDEAGRFKVRSAAGTFRVLARSTLGGALAPGEWTGRYLSADGSDQLDASTMEEISIEVRRHVKP